MTEHLPALLIAVPLIGGVISLFLRGTFLPWAWAQIVTTAVLVITCGLVDAVLTGGTITYRFGAWPQEWGIAYRIDALNVFVLFIVALIGCVATMYARHSVADEIPKDRHHLFYCIWLLALVGLLGITATADVFNVYVLLEVSSLTLYALIAMGKNRDRRALTGALRYVIIGSVGASFILLGIGYLLMVTGTLNLPDMARQLAALPEAARNRTVLVAFAFLFVGLSVKMALFPLHMWLPNAYGSAPSAVSALVAATATKVGVYMAVRFLFSVFGPGFTFNALSTDVGSFTFTCDGVLLFLACVGVLYTGIEAMRQRELKWILAYSSLGQISYMVIGLALLNRDGLTGGIIHLLNHALIKGGMFMAAGCAVFALASQRLDDLNGLGKRMPRTAAAILVGGFGLIGFPLTAGFVSKWYLVKGALAAGHPAVAVVLMLGSVFALVYVWRVVERMYFTAPAADAPAPRRLPLSMEVCTWFLIAGSVFIGIAGKPFADLAGRAADEALTGHALMISAPATAPAVEEGAP